MAPVRCAAILTTLLAMASSFTINIKPSMESITKATESSILLTCDVDVDGGRLQWVDKVKHIVTATAGRVYVETGVRYSKLYVTDIVIEDAGTYTCTATVGGVSQDKSVHLNVYQGITFEHVPNPQTPAINTNATILCHVTGSPKPVVSWRYNQKPIPSGPQFEETSTGLKVYGITENNNGNYTCRAEVESQGTYDERVITVIVHIPPKMKTTVMKIEGTQGNNATLTCAATGLPMPKYEFYKDKQTKALVTSDNIEVNGDYGKISFRPLKKQDNGTYTCKALNDVGEIKIVGSVIVYVPAKISELNNITKAEGETATLICRSEGVPPPEMSFNKVGRAPYRVGINDDRFTVVNRSGQLELSVSNLQPADAGNYTCKSSNKVGVNSRDGSLTVEYKPRFTVEEPYKVYSWAGRTHNITCEAQAHPAPTFRWSRHGRPLTNVAEKYHIFNSDNASHLQVRVKLNDVDWSGDYSCEATNARGSRTLKIQLATAQVPQKPGLPVVKEASPNMIVLTVTPPKNNGGVEIIGYRLEYENKMQDFETGFPDGYYLRVSPNQINKEKNAKGEEMRIENLKPNTKYSFRIRAKNEVGVGDYEMYNTSTPNYKEPYPILIISDKQGSEATSYQLVWATPRTGGKPIKSYEIKYCKAKVDRTTGAQQAQEAWKMIKKPDNPLEPITKYKLEHLEAETTYMAVVLASNEMGTSLPPTSHFVFQTSKVRQRPSKSRAGCAIYSSPRILSFFLFLVLPLGLLTGSTVWTRTS